jgi:pilus assembly protein Flp/PilA
MSRFYELCGGLLEDESGQDLVEYALAAALIGLAAVAGIKNVANGVGSALNNVGNKLNSAI